MLRISSVVRTPVVAVSVIVSVTKSLMSRLLGRKIQNILTPPPNHKRSGHSVQLAGN
jgi:hypothetical protein